MTLPSCTVPTHAEWKNLRTKAGGKPGLSKIEMGKKLDEFHGALKAQDLTKAKAASLVLRNAAKTYAQEVSKKYAPLAAAVTKEIVGKVTSFEDAMDGFDKAEDTVPAKATNIEQSIKQDLMSIIQSTNKTLAALKALGTTAEEWVKKQSKGIPDGQDGVFKQARVVMSQKLAQIEVESAGSKMTGKRVEQHGDIARGTFKEAYGVAERQLHAQQSQIEALRFILKKLPGA